MPTVEPLAAASIMTPMMLLALTRLPLRVSQTAALELAGELGQLGRRARVQAELVDDFSFLLLHCAI